MNHRLIDTPEALAALVAEVRTLPRVGLDTEFHTERSYTPHLMVVQLLLGDDVAIVDPLALRDLRPLADALGQTRVVGHALSSDLRIFADLFDTLPDAVWDTQVAAAFAGYGLSISLLDLVRDLTGVTLRKSQTVSDWSTRPLTPKQLDYLVDDVRYLFDLEDALRERLAARGRERWADDEMRALADVDAYRPDRKRLYLRVSGNARMNRRELGVLNELAVLRERIARERDIPLKYVFPDDVLIGIVQLAPHAIEELDQLRRLDGGTRKRYGQAILDAIARGEALAEDELPPRAPKPLGPQKDALVSTMAVLIAGLAAQHDIPTTMLLPRATLERIARETPRSPDELAAVANLTPWRRDLVVEPLWSLLSGERGLRIEGYGNGDPRTVLV